MICWELPVLSAERSEALPVSWVQEPIRASTMESELCRIHLPWVTSWVTKGVGQYWAADYSMHSIKDDCLSTSARHLNKRLHSP